MGMVCCVPVLHSSGRQISLVVRFVSKIMHKLSPFIRCCIKHLCMFPDFLVGRNRLVHVPTPFPCISGTADVVH